MSRHLYLKLQIEHRSVSGQSLVETALLLPLLTVLLIGLVEFGMIFYAHVQVANAAREAARAASLYRATRYSTFADNASIKDCDGSIKGWSLDQTVRQAIVYRPLLTSGGSVGCPNMSSTAVTYASLGWLDPNSSPAWTITLQDTDSSFIPQPNGDSKPSAGTRASVELRYPYRLIIISNLLPFLQDPIWIRKSVEFEFQQ